MGERQLLYLVKSSTAPRWSDYTVVVATVGVGNVSQLACDLLVHNLNCELFADIDFQSLPAVVGSDPYGSSNDANGQMLMTTSQLYANEANHFAVVQVRAPPFPGCEKRYVLELVSFLRSASFARVIVLSSSFAMQRKDTELMESQLRYAFTESFKDADRQALETRKWPALIQYKQKVLSGSAEGTCKTTYHLPGGGVASRLFDECSGPNGIPVCLLNCFASEGDNAGDALYVVHKLSQWLNLMPEDKLASAAHDVWRAPSSWCLLYGNDRDGCLY